MATLQFPLNNAQDYNGWMTFRFIEVRLDTNVGGAIGSLLDAATRLDTPSSQAEASLENDPAADLEGTDVDGISAGEIRVSREVVVQRDSIRLYLPPQLNFNDGIIYDNSVDLGAIGGAALNALNTTGSVSASQVQDAVMSSIRSVGDLLASGATGDTARIAAMRASRLGGETTRNVISAGLRIAPNPNRRTLFRSVRPREFTFQFKMIANSPQEAEAIDSIIRQFRIQMYPDVANPVEGGEGILSGDFIAYNYPNMVEVDLTYNGRRVGQKIQRGYITNLQTVYNPTSMGYHVDGKPSEVDVTLSIFEERTLDRRDILNGY